MNPSFAAVPTVTAPKARAKPIILPSVSFSLAAIVRYAHPRHHQSNQTEDPRSEHPRSEHPRQYALVHEKPPLGWWLPGGGIEDRDETPVHAAVRETLEEAAVPSLASERGDDYLPRMTHLISLEQTPGRIRFIFRGEWFDDSDRHIDSNGCGGVLKRPPGDSESIEARWITLNEIQCMRSRKGALMHREESESMKNMNDPWLRGHEPMTFFGMLEDAAKHGEMVPGLPLQNMVLHGDVQQIENEEIIGAFFGRVMSESLPPKKAQLKSRGRAEVLVQLNSRLLVYDKSRKYFAIAKETRKFPCSCVKNQLSITLRRLVNDMISLFASPFSIYDEKEAGNNQVGLLRVEHVIHEDGREATLTVFPTLTVLSAREGNSDIEWVPVEELLDSFEKKLAKCFLGLKGKVCDLNILRDSENSL